jgi:DNA-directed RNA polymerase specialized sigma24 family protein
MDDKELIGLARYVVAKIKPNSGDRETPEDCFQIAFLAGLQAKRRAEINKVFISRRYIVLTMQKTVYRQLRKMKTTNIDNFDVEAREENSAALELKDLLDTYCYALTDKQHKTIESFLRGESFDDMACTEKVSRKAVKVRYRQAVKNLREAYESNNE